MEKQLNDKDKEVNTKEGTSTIYEVSYLLLPTLSEEQVPGKVAELKEALVSFGAEVISTENPVLIDLAYSMTKVMQITRHKADQGYFGWIKFEMGSENIEKVKKTFDNHLEVLRYLIVKTVRENTLLNGKMKLKSEDKTRKEEISDESSGVLKNEVAVEEVDKITGDLVVA